uniref:TATA box binding protein associated factor (TAF) histone-like fold domain-containing protein n=1 Tax=Ciona savignyi TaxID=51511 RepID=H2ZJK2_CIOSA
MQDENRKFAVFSQESIRNYAETLGITDLTSTIKQSLAEDVSYRVRELVSNCTQFLRHTRRTKLTANVLNRAIYWNHSPAIIGSESGSNFKQLSDVNLAFDSNINLKEAFEEDTKLKQAPRASISTIDITCDMERIDLSTENEVESDQGTMENSAATKYQPIHQVLH